MGCSSYGDCFKGESEVHATPKADILSRRGSKSQHNQDSESLHRDSLLWLGPSTPSLSTWAFLKPGTAPAHNLILIIDPYWVGFEAWALILR